MMFRTISTAVVAGLLAGLFLFVVQRATMLPLIRAAETHERLRATEPPSGADSVFEKEPLRSAATLLGDMFVAIGFGLILTATYALTGKYGWLAGLLWGVGGVATFNLGPSLVVAPAVPGMEVAALPLRQVVWLVAAGSTAIGLALLLGLDGAARLVGIPVLLLPAVLFRGVLPIPPATTSSPSLAALERVFVMRTLGSALLFWVVLGTVSGQLFARASRHEQGIEP